MGFPLPSEAGVLGLDSGLRDVLRLLFFFPFCGVGAGIDEERLAGGGLLDDFLGAPLVDGGGIASPSLLLSVVGGWDVEGLAFSFWAEFVE